MFWGQLTVINLYTFIRNLNYFLWKLKTSKKQGVSFSLETKQKAFRFQTKPIPQMPVQDAKSKPQNSCHQCSTFSRIGDQAGCNFETLKNMGGSLFSSFGVLGGLKGLGVLGSLFSRHPLEHGLLDPESATHKQLHVGTRTAKNKIDSK